MSGDGGSIGQRIAIGAAWTVSMRVSIRLIGLVSTIVLARLLVPADFGLVAMASLLSGFVMTVSDFNFGVVLIREQRAGRDFYDTAWTLGLIRGACMSCVIALLAAPAAAFFNEPRVTAIAYLFALSVLIQSTSNVGVVDFQKDLDFAREYRFLVGVKISGFIVTMALALALRSYWAMVFGALVSGIVRVGLSYWLHPFRPTLDLSRWREILGFSIWLLITNNLRFLDRQLDGLFVGRMLGSSTLGIYSVAVEIAALATTELVAPVRRAILPGYAKLAHDMVELRRSFIDSFALILMVAIPVAVGIGLLADPLVRVFLGAKWLDAIVVLQVAAIAGLLRASAANSAPMLLALGHVRMVACITLATVIAAAPLLYLWTERFGAVGAAGALCVANGFGLVLYLAVAVRTLSLPVNALLRSVWRTAISCALMSLVVTLIVEARPDVGGLAVNALTLLLAPLAGGSAYLATQLALWHMSGRPAGAERHALDTLARMHKRLSSVRAATR